MGAADDFDTLAEQIHALSTLVNALADHMRILRVALTKGEQDAKEAADRARVGVVKNDVEGQWCPLSKHHGDFRVEWCANAAGHPGPCTFDSSL